MLHCYYNAVGDAIYVNDNQLMYCSGKLYIVSDSSFTSCLLFLLLKLYTIDWLIDWLLYDTSAHKGY